MTRRQALEDLLNKGVDDRDLTVEDIKRLRDIFLK